MPSMFGKQMKVKNFSGYIYSTYLILPHMPIVHHVTVAVNEYRTR